MKIIIGASSSGKTSTALQFIKNEKNSIYLTLDNDTSLLRILNRRKSDYTFIKHCHLLDIKVAILKKGGLSNNRLTHVVVDSINSIKLDKKSNIDKIKYFEQLEKDFGLEIITTFNILTRSDENLEHLEFREYIKKHKVIELYRCK